jgi:hypothetical protein
MKLALLGLPCALALAVPLYNSIEPRLFNFPFFFWAQLALIPVSALCILAAYLGERGDRASQLARNVSLSRLFCLGHDPRFCRCAMESRRS